MVSHWSCFSAPAWQQPVVQFSSKLILPWHFPHWMDFMADLMFAIFPVSSSSATAHTDSSSFSPFFIYFLIPLNNSPLAQKEWLECSVYIFHLLTWCKLLRTRLMIQQVILCCRPIAQNTRHWKKEEMGLGLHFTFRWKIRELFRICFWNHVFCFDLTKLTN